MSNCHGHRFVLAALLAISPKATSAAVIEGTVYKLPPTVVPVDDETVQIRVLSLFVGRDGKPLRDPSTGRLVNGPPVWQGVAQQDGKFTAPIPDSSRQALQMVNIEFKRTTAAVVTQRLEGIIIHNGATLKIDVSVPEPVATAMPTPGKCCPSRQACKHSRRLFGCLAVDD